MTWGCQGGGTYHVSQLQACRAVRLRLTSGYRLVLVRDAVYVSLAQLAWMP